MIYIVIPVHNRQQFTLACLGCLARQTVTEKRVIVVDDGSTDGTHERVRERYPDTIVLTGDGTLWWAGATNLGINYVLNICLPGTDDFILMLNDDTKVDPDYLANLLLAYEANKPCIVGSVSIDVTSPNRLIYAGTRLNLAVPTLEDWAATRFKNSYTQLLRNGLYLVSDSLPGRGMFVPTSVFDRIGTLDVQHFCHHMADLDFSVRARQAGFPLVVSSASVVYEYPDATGMDLTKPMPFRQFINALTSIRSAINYPVRYHFARKHAAAPYLYFIMDMLRIVAGYCRRQLKARVSQL
jgi:GT2 family glycosyltransferase